MEPRTVPAPSPSIPTPEQFLRDTLAASAISEEVANRREYTPVLKKEYPTLGQPEGLLKSLWDDGFWIPLQAPNDTYPQGQLRLITPKPAKDGGVIKYVTAHGKPSLIDLLHYKPDGETVWIIEGVKQADSVASANGDLSIVAIQGCWGWKAKGQHQIRKELVALCADKAVIGLFDGDYQSNANVGDAVTAFLDCFRSTEAVGTPRLASFPVDPTKPSQGIDDYLAAGGTLNDLTYRERGPKSARAVRQKERKAQAQKRQDKGQKDAEKLGIPKPILPEGAGAAQNPLNMGEMLHALCLASGRFVSMAAGVGHYNEETGLWEVKSEQTLSATIYNDYAPKIPQLVFRTAETASFGKRIAADVVNQWRTTHPPSQPHAAPPDTLWCFQGTAGCRVFDQETNEERLLDQGDWFTQAMTYRPDFEQRTCPPSLERILHTAFGGDRVDMMMCQIILAYQVFARNPHQLIFHFMGKGGSGKGTLNRMVNKLVGQDRLFVIASTAKGLTHDSHNLTLYHAKIARLEEDHEDWRVLIPWLKAASGGDPMRARALYQSEPIARPYTGNLMLTTNYTIPASAVDEAFMRRYVPMRFTNATDTPDARVERDLEDDLGRIFGWLWHLYHDNIKGTERNDLWGKDFNMLPEQSQEIRGTLQGGTDGFAGWANQHLRPHQTEQKMRKDVIAQYLLDTQALSPADDDYKKERQKAERQAAKYLDGNGYRTTNNGRVLYAKMTPNQTDTDKDEDE